MGGLVGIDADLAAALGVILGVEVRMTDMGAGAAIAPRLAQRMNPALEGASATLGASRARTFLRVSRPGIALGIVTGPFLVFLQSLDNVSVTLFLGAPGRTMLPLRLFAMLEESLDGRVAAVSGLLILPRRCCSSRCDASAAAPRADPFRTRIAR